MSTDSVSDYSVAIIMQIVFTYLYRPMEQIKYRDSWSNEGTCIFTCMLSIKASIPFLGGGFQCLVCKMSKIMTDFPLKPKVSPNVPQKSLY